MKRLYEITRALLESNLNTNTPMTDKKKIVTSDTGRKARWVEHFKEVLNRPPPPSLANVLSAAEELGISKESPCRI
jgi:hypothetical protein